MCAAAHAASAPGSLMRVCVSSVSDYIKNKCGPAAQKKLLCGCLTLNNCLLSPTSNPTHSQSVQEATAR